MDKSPSQNTVQNFNASDQVNIPGPLIRRALSTTVKNEIHRISIDKRKSNLSSRSYLKQKYRIYHQCNTRKTVLMPIIKSGTRSVSENSPTIARNQAASRFIKHDGAHGRSKGGLQQNSSDTIGNSKDMRNDSPRFEQPHSEKLPSSVLSGESLLIDIPLGVEDRVERLIKAASLRCYVPSFFTDTTLPRAYAIYIAMPPSLAKTKYEQEAYQWSYEWLRRLKSSGFRQIKDLLPVSKLTFVLHDIDAPEILLNKCIEIVQTLRLLGHVPLGKSHRATINRSGILFGSRIKDGKFEEKNTSTSGKDTLKHASNRLAVKEPFLSVVNEPVTKSDDTNIGEKELIPASYQMLDQIVSEGSWCNVNAAAEDLIVHAAFIVCSDDDGGDDEAGMGQEAYLRFAQQVLRSKSKEDRCKIVQNRFRKALAVSTPYVAHLHQRSCYTVLELAKSDLATTDMPLPLQQQVDALISSAVAMSANSRKAYLSNKSLEINRRELLVPLLFDPKFQRSPFDPSGRPPRAATISEIARHREIPLFESSRNDDLPYGIWDSLHNQNSHNYLISKKGSHSIISLDSSGRKPFYQCNFSNCGMRFGRLLNLLKHEKTHSLGAYNEFRINPQIFYDSDVISTTDLFRRRKDAKVSLSAQVIESLDSLRK